jgi:hypothetical protein
VTIQLPLILLVVEFRTPHASGWVGIYLTVTLTCLPMAPIDEYREQITTWKEEGLTSAEIIGRLHDDHVKISQATLTRRLQAWGIRRNTTFPVTNELIKQVQTLYLQNLLTDAQIASRITDEGGNCPTVNQIKEIRLAYGFQRRVKKHDLVISAARTEATQAVVAHLFYEGGGRSYGYRWAQSSLRRRLGHNARQSDIRLALR